jgi:hypothetical protein
VVGIEDGCSHLEGLVKYIRDVTFYDGSFWSQIEDFTSP